MSALLAAVLAPSCVADPNAFTDGLALGVLGSCAVALMLGRRPRRRP